MKKNNKGFTLIESVITIAVIAIASTMLIFGVTSIIKIFTDASLIKTNTNTIFESISNEIGTNSDNYSDSIVLKRGSIAFSPIPVATISDSLNEPTEIKLSYFNPQYKATQLPGESVEPPEPEIGQDMNIRILSNKVLDPSAFGHLSLDYHQYSDLDEKYYEDFGVLKNCLRNTQSGMIYQGPALNSLFINKPPQSMADEAYQALIRNFGVDDPYVKLLSNGYKLKYVCATTFSHSTGIFCYLVPKEKGVYISYYNNFFRAQALWCPITIVNGKQTVDLSALPDSVTSLETLSADGVTRKTYTRDMVKNLEFLDDVDPNETFYNFTNRKGIN